MAAPGPGHITSAALDRGLIRGAAASYRPLDAACGPWAGIGGLHGLPAWFGPLDSYDFVFSFLLVLHLALRLAQVSVLGVFVASLDVSCRAGFYFNVLNSATWVSYLQVGAFVHFFHFAAPAPVFRGDGCFCCFPLLYVGAELGGLSLLFGGLSFSSQSRSLS